MADMYFAKKDVKEIGPCLFERIEQYYRSILTTQRIALWRDIYKQYYSGYYSGGSIETVGKKRNKRKISVNHFRNILQHIQILTTNQRPAFEPRAVNSDYKTYAQVILAKSLLSDYYMSQAGLEDYFNTCIEHGVVMGEGWLYLEWDENIGAEKIGKGGEKYHVGDLLFRAFSPLDVVRDVTKPKLEEHDWFILRRTINKYELASKYPDWEKEILDQPPYWTSGNDRDLVILERDTTTASNSDEITLYTFLHKRTTACPDGRMVHLCADNVIPFDGPLPYNDFPLVPLIPETQKGCPFGYSVSFDMLPIQKAYDVIESSILTNQMAFGVQSIKSEKGAGVSVTEISEGLNLLEYNDGLKGPEPINFTATPAEIFTHKNELVQEMESISGVNSVARGQPESSLRSGAALALIHSTALQFNKGLQRAYIRMLEDTGTAIINILKRYADTGRVAAIAGISNRSYLKEFSGDDLNDIDRVIVDVGNPVTRTTAGKVNMAEMLAERGLIRSIEQFKQVLETGDARPVTEGETAENMLVKSENERLSNGEYILVVDVENHKLHINEHKVVLASPEAKDQKEVVEATLDHIYQHLQSLATAPPDLLMLLGQQPIGQGMMPPPGEEQQEEQGAPGGQEPPTGQPMEAQMPSMPTNPMTEQQYSPEEGA